MFWGQLLQRAALERQCTQPGTPAQDSHAFHLPWWFLWILLPLPGAVWAAVEELRKVFSCLLKPEAISMCSYCSSRKCLGTSLRLSLPCLLWPKPLNPTVSPPISLALLGGFGGHIYLPSQLLSTCVPHIWTSHTGPSGPPIL